MKLNPGFFTFSGVKFNRIFEYQGEIVEYRMCPSCGTASFFSALSGDKIVFHVNDSSELIMLPDQSFDEILLYVNPWTIYCDACAWSGPIDDLILAEV